MGESPKQLKPFFCYFGGKWRVAPKYPAPEYTTIIEPFAGAAGYSLRHYQRDIVLIEKNETIARLWKWLIGATSDEILSLPLTVEHVDQIDCCQEAKWLIGFWLNKGTVHPCKTPSRWVRENIRPNSYWGGVIRQRIASQVEHIRHWEIVHGDYHEVPNTRATWFIDPPYIKEGKNYPCRTIDYESLGRWCQGRNGQVIVCESAEATWLPFVPYLSAKTTEGKNHRGKFLEGIWLK